MNVQRLEKSKRQYRGSRMNVCFWGILDNNYRNQFCLLVWFEKGDKKCVIFHMKSQHIFLIIIIMLEKINIVSSRSYAQIMLSSIIWTIICTTYERRNTSSKGLYRVTDSWHWVPACLLPYASTYIYVILIKNIYHGQGISLKQDFVLR